MPNKVLSISIPTWNRSSYLKELLDELIRQIQDDRLSDSVEIIISNNGSVDDTHELVSGMMKTCTFITYNRNPENIGGNPNVMKSMQLASADYLIFLGDDDRVEKGSLKRIVNFLQTHQSAGIIIDTANITTYDKSTSESELNLKELLHHHFWFMGNAGVFVTKSSYVKECIEEYGLGFFNQCWSQTQFMILGNYHHRSDRIYLENLNIVSHSVHTDLTIYNSFYLWRAGYFELYCSIVEMEKIIGREMAEPAYKYLKRNIYRFAVMNILQSGIFVDSMEIRRKTRQHMQKNIGIFSLYERIIFYFIAFVLWLPVWLTRFVSDSIILLSMGPKGMKKKNEFVNKEREKERRAGNAKSISVRKLEFETDGY